LKQPQLKGFDHELLAQVFAPGYFAQGFNYV